MAVSSFKPACGKYEIGTIYFRPLSCRFGCFVFGFYWSEREMAPVTTALDADVT